MTRKKALRKRVRELERELRETVRQAYFAEEVCRAAGRWLDPANKYVQDDRLERLTRAFGCWAREVPNPPYRGLLYIDIASPRAPGSWPRVEYLDNEGFWRLLLHPDEKEA